MIPNYQDLMRPVLEFASTGEVQIRDAVEFISHNLGLTDEEKNQLLPSGKQTTIANRIHWARSYLKQAGLVENTKRGHYKLTKRGHDILADNNVKLNSAYSDPYFFEEVIIELFISMGYGGSTKEAGRAIGQSGDDGVDGVIDQDPLGVDQIYLQAKRYAQGNNIGPSAIRDFFGALSLKRATKGIFVTTSKFSDSATKTAENLGSRIVLIDGNKLARLMIQYNIGCRDEEILRIKKLDEGYFLDNQ